MYCIVWCFVLFLSVCAHTRTHGADHAVTNRDGSGYQPVVVTPLGEVRGGFNVTRRGRQFESYRGIRYAEPPVGELRFQPPRPIHGYDEPVDATRDGPACPMPASPGYPIDEDCLTINVYTPLRTERSKLLPVIFFIHPGGFYSMTGRSDLAGPHYLLDRDIVLVTINYRLASLGFLSTGDRLAPGNNGLKDQVVAMKWVRENIASFGGDPGSVTIAGCSAGAASVMLHMISPMSRGLFHRGISLSGSPIRKVPSPTNQYHLTVKQAELMNCPTNSSQLIIDCLKTKSWRDLAYSLNGFYEFSYDPLLIWSPVVEPYFEQERFLPIDPIDAIKQGKMQAVPYIIGQTEGEFFWKAFTILKNETLLNEMNKNWNSISPISFILPRENATIPVKRLRHHYLLDRTLRNDRSSAKQLGKLYADSIENFHIHRLARLMSLHSPQPVWRYLFSYTGNHSHYVDPQTKKPIVAAHHDDLIYLLTLQRRFPDIGRDGDDSLMVDRMTALWYNFVRYGEPTPRGDTPELGTLNWPKLVPEDMSYLRIDKDFETRNNLFEEDARVWEELYPIEY